MERINLMTYGVIGFICALIFGITLNVGWEVIFVNLFIGFVTAIIKCMRKGYDFYFAAGNFGLPVFVAGITVQPYSCFSLFCWGQPFK